MVIQEINVEVASSFRDKLIGLMFTNNIRTLYFPNVSSIHSFFCKKEIAIFHLDKFNKVIDKYIIKPYRFGKFVKGTQHILECDKDLYSKIEKGTILKLNIINNKGGMFNERQ